MEDSEKNSTKPATPLFLTCMNAINNVTHFCLGTITICAFTYAATLRVFGNLVISTSSFSQHIILCVIGYVMLMSQAFLVFNPYVGWSSTLKHPHKRLAHIILQVCGSSLALTGCLIKITDSYRNFSSTHAYMGFVTMLLTVLSLIGGVLNFLFADKAEKKKLYQFLYASLNGVTLSFAFITLAIAFGEYYRTIVPSGIANWAITLTVVGLVGLLSSVFMKYIWKKI